MNERGDRGHDDAGRIFAPLKDRPTPELDSEQLWRRIVAGLEPRRRSGSRRRPGGGVAPTRVPWRLRAVGAGKAPPPWAAALAAAAVVVVLVAAGMWMLGGSEPVVEEGARIVWMQPDAAAADPAGGSGAVETPPRADDPAAGDTPGGTAAAGNAVAGAAASGTSPRTDARPGTSAGGAPAGAADDLGAAGAARGAVTATPPVRLDARLVRGFDGAPPADVQVGSTAAAGGADPLGDVRDDLRALLHQEGYGLVGRWEGEAMPGALPLALGGGYGLSFTSAHRHADGSVELAGVRFEGSGRALVAQSLRMFPDRPLLLGIPAEDGSQPSLLLVLRLE